MINKALDDYLINKEDIQEFVKEWETEKKKKLRNDSENNDVNTESNFKRLCDFSIFKVSSKEGNSSVNSEFVLEPTSNDKMSINYASNSLKS